MRIRKILFNVLCVVSLVIVLVTQYALPVAALSPDQKKIFESGINYYDIDSCAGGGGR